MNCLAIQAGFLAEQPDNIPSIIHFTNVHMLFILCLTVQKMAIHSFIQSFCPTSLNELQDFSILSLLASERKNGAKMKLANKWEKKSSQTFQPCQPGRASQLGSLCCSTESIRDNKGFPLKRTNVF